MAGADGTYNRYDPSCTFNITAAASITINYPTAGFRGDTFNVTIIGTGTHFVNGTSIAVWGAGGVQDPRILINSTTVTDATHCTANITIYQNAPLGNMSVTVKTGAETPTGDLFLISNPRIQSVFPPGELGYPAFGYPGETLSVSITGTHTHFLQDSSIPALADFGAGITINSILVSDTDECEANITISPLAAVGFRNVNIGTHYPSPMEDEVPTPKANGFEVRALVVPQELSGAFEVQAGAAAAEKTPYLKSLRLEYYVGATRDSTDQWVMKCAESKIDVAARIKMAKDERGWKDATLLKKIRVAPLNSEPVLGRDFQAFDVFRQNTQCHWILWARSSNALYLSAYNPSTGGLWKIKAPSGLIDYKIRVDQTTGVDTSQPVRVNVEPNSTNLWLLWVNKQGNKLYTALNTYYLSSGSYRYHFKSLEAHIAKTFADDNDIYLNTTQFYPGPSGNNKGTSSFAGGWSRKGGSTPYYTCSKVNNRSFTVVFYGNQLDMEAFRTHVDKGYAANESRYTDNVHVQTSIYLKSGSKWIHIKDMSWNNSSKTWKTLVSGLASGYHTVKVTINDVTGLDWGHVTPGMMSYMAGPTWAYAVAHQNDFSAGRGQDSIYISTKDTETYTGERSACFFSSYMWYPGTPGGWSGTGFPSGWSSRGVKRLDFMVAGVHEDSAPHTLWGICLTCNGSGWVKDPYAHTCPKCGGTGEGEGNSSIYEGWQIRVFRMKGFHYLDNSWYDRTRPQLKRYEGYNIAPPGKLTYIEQTWQTSRDLYTKGSPNRWAVFNPRNTITANFGGSAQKKYDSKYIGRRQVHFDDTLSGDWDGWWGWGFELHSTGLRPNPGNSVNFYIWNQHAQFNIRTPKQAYAAGDVDESSAYVIAGFRFNVSKFQRKQWDPIYGHYGSFQLNDAAYGTYESLNSTSEFANQWLISGPFKAPKSTQAEVYAYDYIAGQDPAPSDEINEATVGTGGKTYGGYNYSPAQGRPIVNNSASPKWFKYFSDTDKVDLMAAFDELAGKPSSALENSCCYAFTWLWVAEGGNYQFSVGVDDGFKCWINGGKNGSPNYAINKWHALEPDKYQFTANLNAGWNSIMMKVVNGPAGADLGVRWEFQMRVRLASGVSLVKGDYMYSVSREKVASNPIIIYDAPELPINKVDNLIKFIEGNYKNESSNVGNWNYIVSGNFARVGNKSNKTYGHDWAAMLYYMPTKSSEGYIRSATFTLKHKLPAGWHVHIMGITDRDLRSSSSYQLLDVIAGPVGKNYTRRLKWGFASPSRRYVGFAFKLKYVAAGTYPINPDYTVYLQVQDLLVEFHGRTTNNIIIGVDQSSKNNSTAPFAWERFSNTKDYDKVKYGLFYKDVSPRYASRATLLDYQNSLFIFWQKLTTRKIVNVILSKSTDSFTITNAADWEHCAVKNYNWSKKGGLACSLRFDIVRTPSERFLVVEQPYLFNNNKVSLNSRYRWTWWPQFVPSPLPSPMGSAAILAAEPIGDGEAIMYMYDRFGNIWTTTSYTKTNWLSIDDNVESVEVSSSDDPTADSCTVNFINEDGMWNPTKEYLDGAKEIKNPYYGWLPTSVWDRTPRRVYIEIGIKTIYDKDYIWKKVFTGVVSGFNQDVSYTNVSVPITCLDFGQQLNKYKTPENLVWAENPIIWGDNFNDYDMKVGERSEVVSMDRPNPKLWDTTDGDYYFYNVDPLEHEMYTEHGGWIYGKRCYTKNDQKTKVPETQTATYAVQMKIDRALPIFQLKTGDGSFIRFDSATKWWEFRNPNSTTSPVTKLFKWTPPIDDWFRMELRLASGRGSHGMKFTIIHGETTKTKSMSDYSYGVRAGRKTLPPHRLALYTSKGARFRTPYVAERMNKTWEQVVEDIYRKGFQGLAPIYRIKVDDDLWTPLHAPMVWLANQTAAEALDRICAINGTRWRFDEEGTFIYEQDDLDDSVTTITDDEIESFNYQFSTFEYLNWVDAKGGSDNNISSTAAYGNSVASDGIRYELIEDSGLKNTDEATRKARAKLYGSMADVEGGSLVTFFPRLDISPRDLIYIHSDVAGTDKTYYVKDVSKMFNIESREISTEFTLKSQETELLSDIAEYYDGGVVY